MKTITNWIFLLCLFGLTSSCQPEMSNKIKVDPEVLAYTSNGIRTESMMKLQHYKSRIEGISNNLDEGHSSVLKKINLVLELLENEQDYLINVDSIVEHNFKELLDINWLDTSKIQRTDNPALFNYYNSLNLRFLTNSIYGIIAICSDWESPNYVINYGTKYTICKGDTLKIQFNAVPNHILNAEYVEISSKKYKIEKGKRKTYTLNFVPSKNDFELPNQSDSYATYIHFDAHDILNDSSFVIKDGMFISYKLVDCL